MWSIQKSLCMRPSLIRVSSRSRSTPPRPGYQVGRRGQHRSQDLAIARQEARHDSGCSRYRSGLRLGKANRRGRPRLVRPLRSKGSELTLFQIYAGHAILIPPLRPRHDSTRPLFSNYCHSDLPGTMYRLLCRFTRSVAAPDPSFICRDLFVALSFYTYYELVCFACFVISR